MAVKAWRVSLDAMPGWARLWLALWMFLVIWWMWVAFVQSSHFQSFEVSCPAPYRLTSSRVLGVYYGWGCGDPPPAVWTRHAGITDR